MSGGALVLLFLLNIATGACLAADPPAKIAHVGFLRAEVPDNGFEPFRRGLEEHGFVEGRNLVIEQRWAYGKYADLPRLARELVDLKVDVIYASCGVCTEAARGATGNIPIVTVSGDPVKMGFAASLSRPEGNITGFSLMLDELSVKRLQFLKELAPKTSKVAVLWVTSNPFWERIIPAMTRAASALGIQVESVKIAAPNLVQHALATLARRRVNALYVFEDPVLRNESVRIIEFAAKHRLPAIYGGVDYVRQGGLISYAPSFADLFRKAGGYVAEILGGKSPADLPIQQPTKFDLVVNLKTAKALGLTVPESILVFANEVIK